MLNLIGIKLKTSQAASIALATLALLTVSFPATGQGEATPTPDAAVSAKEVKLSPVSIDGVTLFYVRGVSSFPAEKRAAEISSRIEKLAGDKTFDPNSLQLSEQDNTSMILAGNLRVMAVLVEDALVEKVERKVLATLYLKKIRESITDFRQARTPEALTTDVLYILVATVAFVVFVRLGRRINIGVKGFLDRRLRARIEHLESKSFQIVRAQQVWTALEGFLQLIWVVLVLLAALWYFDVALSMLPWTRAIGQGLFTILSEPLKIMVSGLVDFIPDLAFLIILVFVVRYLLKALRIFFGGIETEAIKFENFDADWAWPTYRLVKLVVIAFSLVIAFPYIPGSGSDAFKGISVFFGLVLSLSSSSVISNMIAGYTMIYRRAFKLGDRIKVGEDVGDVTAIRQLVTHLRTIKNEEIVVPNSSILNNSVVNYSTLARQGKLLLHTTVGIGYETPWRQVEAMLLQAAAQTDDVRRDPAPFVLHKTLGDFCVVYELNVYCDNAQAMASLYTALHRNILDVFNEYGVQIMTPAYEGDPQEPKVVSRENWFLSPARPSVEQLEK